MKRESRKGDTAVTVELECLACHARESVELSAEKFKALSSLWKIEQDCDACGGSTEWSFAEARVEAEEQVDFWDWLATTGEYFEPAAGAPQDERRKERRIEAHVPLYVTALDGGEEEVTSENISRSGLCFSSGKTYRTGETIQVRVQPPGAPGPQTKTATIVRASAPVEGKSLYGVRFET